MAGGVDGLRGWFFLCNFAGSIIMIDVMTEKEKMLAGLPYSAVDAQLL